MATASNNDIYLNEKFSSYKELENKIKSYEKNKYVSLYKRSSRTITGAVKQMSLAANKLSGETKLKLE